MRSMTSPHTKKPTMVLLRYGSALLRRSLRSESPHAAAALLCYSTTAATSTVAATAAPAPSTSSSEAAHNFSFSGSGFLISYHLGVAQGLCETGFLTPQSKVAGASGGSITALAIAAGVDLLEIHDEAKKMVALCRGEGTLWKLEARLRFIFTEKFANASLDALNSRLTVATRQVWPKQRTVQWNRFDSITDAGNAVVASCYIPFYLARPGATKFRGELHVDGGLLELVPEIPGYVKVCVFHAKIFRRDDYEISPSLVPDFPYSIWELARASLVPPDATMLDELFELGKQSAFVWAETMKTKQKQLKQEQQ